MHVMLFSSSVCFTTAFLFLLSMFTLNGDVVTVTTPSDCRWLQVEFQQNGGEEGDKEEERKKVKVPATGNMVSIFVPQLVVSSSYLYLHGRITLLSLKKVIKSCLLFVSYSCCVR